MTVRKHNSFKLSAKNFSVSAVVILSLLILFSASFYRATANAASGISFHSVRDCDNNAIIDCGALSANEVVTSYRADQTVQKIYTAFGITSTDVSELSTSATAGKVYANGNVYIAGRASSVASNTISATRQPVGSSMKKTSQGISYYQVNTKSAVNGSYSSAFVVMKNNRFAFAIIASNGDPVMAKQVRVQTVTTKPTPSLQPVAANTTQNSTLASTGPATATIVSLFTSVTLIGCVFSYGYRIRKLNQ